jgi:hypothetical protein
MVSAEVVVAATNPISESLLLLTSAALALPMMIPRVEAATPPTKIDSDFSYAHYGESNGRMNVDVFREALVFPVLTSLEVDFEYIHDTMAGASPVTNRLDNQGNVVQILSNASAKVVNPYSTVTSRASIKDQRDKFSGGFSYFLNEDVTLGVHGGNSTENDYISNFVNADAAWETNKKNTTFTASYAFSSDKLWNVRFPTALEAQGTNQSHQGMLGVTQTLDKNSNLQFSLTYGHREGYQSDPYKYMNFPDLAFPVPNVGIQSIYLHEVRPTNKDSFTPMLRYVRFFDDADATLHFDYRYYADTWGVDAHTFETSWVQHLPSGWTITPSVRYYTQSSADFYDTVMSGGSSWVPLPGYYARQVTNPGGKNATPVVYVANNNYSSDYRLASFGALSGGLLLSKNFSMEKFSTKLSAGVEYYDRQQSFSISGGKGSSIDDFSFVLYSANLKISF